MKPGFALSLSFEGISLLCRSAGGWRLVGEVDLDSADVAGDLAGLRDLAADLDAGPLTTKLILPNDQIRYLSVATGMADTDTRDTLVREALNGATPYAVDDLVFDLSVEGEMTHVAALARETLAEAETFAVEHGFEPLCFVGVPGDMPFLGEPYFGATLHADTVLSGGQPVEPDGISVVVVGKVEPRPVADAAHVLAAELPTDDAGAAPQPASVTAEGSGGFVSRRARRSAAPPPEPAIDADPPLPEPVSFEAPPEPEPEYEPKPELVSPTLEVADPPPPPASSGSVGTRLSGFFSRRKAPQDDPVPVAAAARVIPAPVQTIAAPPPGDEAARLTVFGARTVEDLGGKPRHLGLILTAALLVFLAGVAVWAALYLDDGVAGLLPGSDQSDLADTANPDADLQLGADGTILTRVQPDATELAEEPEPDQVPDVQSAIGTFVSPDEDAQAPDAADVSDETGADPSAPGLTDTDTAVLDALRTPESNTDPEADDITPEVTYAATGIWPQAPTEPQVPALIGLDDLYPTSIDSTDLAQDAVALAAPAEFATDAQPAALSSPVPAGTQFDLDERGLVVPTVAGAVSPDGVIVYQGRPPLVPPPTPTRFEAPVETEELQAQLPDARPRLRPSNLVELTERSQLGGLSLSELAAVRPLVRPETDKDVAEQDETPTAQAIAASRVPRLRPQGLAQQAAIRLAARPAVASAAPAAAASTAAAPTQVAAVAPRTVTPRIPSTASVARQATLNNAINLRKVNLIGVYGTPSNRRALVRLPSGRYKKVKVGDKVDGGRVSAIGDSELRYQKGGRNLVLSIPSG